MEETLWLRKHKEINMESLSSTRKSQANRKPSYEENLRLTHQSGSLRHKKTLHMRKPLLLSTKE